MGCPLPPSSDAAAPPLESTRLSAPRTWAHAYARLALTSRRPQTLGRCCSALCSLAISSRSLCLCLASPVPHTSAASPSPPYLYLPTSTRDQAPSRIQRSLARHNGIDRHSRQRLPVDASVHPDIAVPRRLVVVPGHAPHRSVLVVHHIQSTLRHSLHSSSRGFTAVNPLARVPLDPRALHAQAERPLDRRRAPARTGRGPPPRRQLAAHPAVGEATQGLPRGPQRVQVVAGASLPRLSPLKRTFPATRIDPPRPALPTRRNQTRPRSTSSTARSRTT